MTTDNDSRLPPDLHAVGQRVQRVLAREGMSGLTPTQLQGLRAKMSAADAPAQRKTWWRWIGMLAAPVAAAAVLYLQFRNNENFVGIPTDVTQTDVTQTDIAQVSPPSAASAPKRAARATAPVVPAAPAAPAAPPAELKSEGKARVAAAAPPRPLAKTGVPATAGAAAHWETKGAGAIGGIDHLGASGGPTEGAAASEMGSHDGQPSGVDVEQVVVQGGLTQSEVKATVGSYAPTVLPCLTANGASSPSSLKVHLTVGVDGRVKKATAILPSRLASVRSCVEEAMRRWTFPGATSTSIVTLSIMLRPQP